MAKCEKIYTEKHFSDLYEKYQKAKKKNGPHIWGKAITCIEYLHKITDSKKELRLFGEFMSKEEATESYRELCRDSRSYPQN